MTNGKTANGGELVARVCDDDLSVEQAREIDAQDERAGTTALRPDSAHRDALRTRGVKAAGVMQRMAPWTDVDGPAPAPDGEAA